MTMITHSKNNGTRSGTTETVADILERELDLLIHDWMQLVEKQDDLMAMTLGYEDRTGYLPVLLQEVIARLRLDAGTKALSQSPQVITATCVVNRAIRSLWWSRSLAFFRCVCLRRCTKIQTGWSTANYCPTW